MTDNQHFELIIAQCTNQNALSPRQIAGFTRAYFYVLEKAIFSQQPNGFLWDIYDLAGLIEEGNQKEDGTPVLRCTPATFANGNVALPPDQIDRQLQLFTESYCNSGLTAEELYQWFEEIHPYNDGNGRLGHLLWAYHRRYKGKGWPLVLPPEFRQRYISQQNSEV